MSEFLIVLEALELPRVRELWSWLVPLEYRPIAVSAFGDLFYEDPRGAVHMADAIDGALRQVADSGDDFRRRSEEKDFADDVLLASWVRRLRECGTELGEGQCYGWKLLPALGAPMTMENIAVFDVMKYMVITSTVLKELEKLPPGTRVSKFLVDGNDRGAVS